jgi:hypothetical protein
MIHKGTIVEDNARYRRISTPHGLYFIGEDDHPELKLGATVTVRYDPEDQYATIVGGDRSDHSIAPDLKEVYDTLEARGFRKPPAAYLRDDPRGKGYGHFEVWVCDSDNIKVTHVTTDPAEPYTMVFRTVQDFRRWARQNT